MLAQMVACLPLVQQVRGSITGGVVNVHLKIFNLGARRGGDVHFLITRSRVRKSRYSGETLQSPIHCCDLTKLPYLFSGEL